MTIPKMTKITEHVRLEKMPLNFYNTAMRQKETFVPLEGRLVRMYTCGPTVYNYAHIGNFRTYVFEDLLRRTFKVFRLSSDPGDEPHRCR